MRKLKFTLTHQPGYWNAWRLDVLHPEGAIVAYYRHLAEEIEWLMDWMLPTA